MLQTTLKVFTTISFVIGNPFDSEISTYYILDVLVIPCLQMRLAVLQTAHSGWQE